MAYTEINDLYERVFNRFENEDLISKAEVLQMIANAPAADNVIALPCKVGDTIYRLDYRIKRCSLHHMYSKGNEYYCGEDYNCFLYNTPACDCGEEYYIFDIKIKDIATIVCNMKGIGKTVFFSREAAEKALAKMKEGTAK